MTIVTIVWECTLSFIRPSSEELLPLDSLNIIIFSFRAIPTNQLMEFHLTNSNNIFDNGMVMHIKVNVTLVPDIQEFLPFGCLNFNEMVPT